MRTHVCAEAKVRRIRDVHAWLRRRPGPSGWLWSSSSCLAWSGIELITSAGQPGLAERVLGEAQSACPFAVALSCRHPFTMMAAHGRPLHGRRGIDDEDQLPLSSSAQPAGHSGQAPGEQANVEHVGPFIIAIASQVPSRRRHFAPALSLPRCVTSLYRCRTGLKRDEGPFLSPRRELLARNVPGKGRSAPYRPALIVVS